MIQANIDKARQRIQTLINQDDDTDKQSKQYYSECMLFIKAHLMSFFSKYAKDNSLSVSEVSQSATTWDMQQWVHAINNTNMKQWPDSAIDRVKMYGHVAGLSTRHTIESLMALGIIIMTVKNQNNIISRIDTDFKQQLKLAKAMVNSHVSDKKLVSVITQQSTRDIWSDNLWIDSDNLANDVQNLVNRHLKHGMSLQDLENILSEHANSKQFKPNQYIGDRVKQMEFNARRIVRTESSRLIDEANTVTYRLSGITQVDIVNQPNACGKCMDLANGGPYSINNCPSIPNSTHPSCRCYKIPTGDSHSRLITVNRIF